MRVIIRSRGCAFTDSHIIEHMRVRALVSRYVLHIRSELAGFMYTRVFVRQAYWQASERASKRTSMRRPC